MMAFDFTSKNKKIVGSGNATGTLPNASAAPSSLDGGTSSYGRLSRPRVSESSGKSFTGNLIEGAPRVTSGATAYAGADPASAQLDTFARRGSSALKQEIDAKNTAVEQSNQQVSSRNQLAQLTDTYNNALARFRSDLSFGNPHDRDPLVNDTVLPGATGTVAEGGFNTSGFNGYYHNEDTRNQLAGASTALMGYLQDYQVPDSASPEFKAYVDFVRQNGAPETWGWQKSQQYDQALVRAGVMDARFAPNNSQGGGTYLEAEPTRNVAFNNSPLGTSARADYNLPALGLSGSLPASSPEPGVYGAQAQYTPWLDTVVNSNWGWDFGASPDAPYLNSGYGGRFTSGRLGEGPAQFSSRDLSGEVSELQPTFNYLGETETVPLAEGERELFGGRLQAPVTSTVQPTTVAPRLTGGRSTSFRGAGNNNQSIEYRSYAPGGVPELESNSVIGVTGGQGNAYFGGGYEFRQTPSGYDVYQGSNFLSSIPAAQMRLITAGYY